MLVDVLVELRLRVSRRVIGGPREPVGGGTRGVRRDRHPAVARQRWGQRLGVDGKRLAGIEQLPPKVDRREGGRGGSQLPVGGIARVAVLHDALLRSAEEVQVVGLGGVRLGDEGAEVGRVGDEHVVDVGSLREVAADLRVVLVLFDDDDDMIVFRQGLRRQSSSAKDQRGDY